MDYLFDFSVKDHRKDLKDAQGARRREANNHSSSMSSAARAHNSAISGHSDNRDMYTRWRREEDQKFYEFQRNNREASKQEEEHQSQKEQDTHRQNHENQLKEERQGNLKIEQEQKSGTSCLHLVQKTNLTEKQYLEGKRTRMIKDGNEKIAIVRGIKDNQEELKVSEEKEYGETLLNQTKESQEKRQLMQSDLNQELLDQLSRNEAEHEKVYALKTKFEVDKYNILLAGIESNKKERLQYKESSIGNEWDEFCSGIRNLAIKKALKTDFEKEKWSKTLAHLANSKLLILENSSSTYKDLLTIIDRISESLNQQNFWQDPKPIFEEVKKMIKEFNEIWADVKCSDGRNGYLEALIGTSNQRMLN